MYGSSLAKEFRLKKTYKRSQLTFEFSMLNLVSIGNLSLTVCSWTGLNYCVDNRERNLYFETFLKFILAFRTLNNYKLRILIGGLFNVDLKVVQV